MRALGLAKGGVSEVLFFVINLFWNPMCGPCVLAWPVGVMRYVFAARGGARSGTMFQIIDWTKSPRYFIMT
jgi:hypothetical protein